MTTEDKELPLKINTEDDKEEEILSYCTIPRSKKEMGLVDELGSGVRNIHKYGKIYFGH